MNQLIPNRKGFILLLDHDPDLVELTRIREGIRDSAERPEDWMVLSNTTLAEPEELKKLLAQLRKEA